ncbi:MAG: adenylate kinase [Bacteroidales bacterium]
MKNNTPLNIVLLGAPGSGKGTQAQLIKEKYRLDHVSTGDMFRREIASKSAIGLHAKEIIDRGGLCPDSLTLDMLNSYLIKFHAAKGYILDGVPRTIEQAKMMDGIDYAPPVPVTLVIYIYVEEEEMTKRILKRAELLGRSDDTPEVIKTRISNYYRQTKPLKNYYEKQHKLYEVNGMNSVEEVFKNICIIIDNCLKNK